MRDTDSRPLPDPVLISAAYNVGAENQHAARLLGKIDSRTARVAVIGVGYVGLPLAIAIARAGFATTGYDVNAPRVAGLQAGHTGLAHLPDAALTASGLAFSADPQALAGCDVFLICVPTGLRDGVPDLSHVRSAVATVARVVGPGCLVSLESTTYPGTTREIVWPALRGNERIPRSVIGHDSFVCYSPEREDPGRQSHDLASTPKLVGGGTAACGDVAAAFYRTICRQVVRVASPEAAEMAKLVENTFRAVNIALANELKGACDALGVDFYAAMDAAATKPFGFMPFYPGPGVGGHCIPVDPVYLTWRAAMAGGACPLIERALQVNAHAHERALDALADRLELAGARILLVGAAYKPGVSDTRESPIFPLWRALTARGAAVEYHDPLVADMAGHTDDFAGFNAAVIVTNQAGVDYERLRAEVPLIVDCRRSYPEALAGVVRA